MKERIEKQLMETYKSISLGLETITATKNVISAALTSEADPNYVYKCPERQALHEKAPPIVQSVNQHCDRQNIPLAKDHVPHFERQFSIDSYCKNGDYEENLKKWGKTVKNENKTANSFLNESKEYQGSFQQKKQAYAQGGYLAHTIFGSAKAGVNPYVIHEDDLGVGTITDYVVHFNQDMKQ